MSTEPKLFIVGLVALLTIAAVPDQPRQITFAELGWTEDAVISASSPAVLRFELPEGVRQGDPHWYGVWLKFQLHGNPGWVGDYAFLSASWNGYAVYQFKTQRITTTDSGIQWSMVDMVNGGNGGYELTDSIAVASSNMAQDDAVRGGLNELRFSLRLSGASNKETKSVVSRESRIIVTS